MHTIIIGNGIAGITTARHIRKLDPQHQITVISAETKHFFSRTALMYIYMGHMTYENTKPYEDHFWEKNRIDLVFDYVDKIDFDQKKLHLKSANKLLKYDKLVLALGSKSNKFGWKGQDLDGVQGLYSKNDLDLLEKNTATPINRAVIVGGGLIGIEFAEMLASRRIPVTFLVRESGYWNNVLPLEESQLINRHILAHHFDLRLSSELQEIVSDKSGRVKAVITKDDEMIPCQLVGLTAGVSPNIAFLKNTALETARGILIDHYLQTNIADVYAVGDCAQFREPLPDRRPIEQVWYTGRIQGEAAAQNICGKAQKYQPRVWFNSAKFLDIEYQTYGMVMPKLREGEAQLYWEHPDGEKCVKMIYNTENQRFIGINIFGIRMRHQVFEQWLLDGANMDTILQNLALANFDPEFFDTFEQEILETYNHQTGKHLTLKKHRGLWSVARFLGR